MTGEIKSGRKPQKLVQLALLLSATSQFPLVANLFRCFQTMMLTVNKATMNLKHKFQMKLSLLLTFECINEITPKVNWKKSLTSMNKQRHIQLPDEETLSLRTKLKKILFENSIPTMMMWQSTIVPWKTFRRWGLPPFWIFRHPREENL